MADILLSFGLKHNAALDENLAGDLSAAIKKVEASAPKIKVGVQIDPNSLNTFKSQLTRIVNSVTTGTGKPISLKIDGLGNITADADKAANAVKKVGDVAKQATSAVENSGGKIAKALDISKAVKKIDAEVDRVRKNLNNWTASKNGETADQYEVINSSLSKLLDLRNELNNQNSSIDDDVFNKRYDAIISKLRNARFEIKSANEDTSTLGARFMALSKKFGSWLTVSQVVMKAYEAARKMLTTAIEVDTAMTELKKVTNETDATYDKFLDNAATRAKEVGATLTDVVNASASFARLGYDIDEAANLADTAIVYKNVADDIDSIDVASSSIISTMQAFGVEANNAISIVDKFNEVSNNFAITSGGLGEALQRSAAAMNAAGNTLDETIALVTAANTVVQNPESVC